MDYSTGIVVVKIISMISTAAFAILGTLTEFKKEGKLTHWGKISICGVILFATLSGITLGFEQQKNLKDSQDANAEKNALKDSLKSLIQNASQSLEQINDLSSESQNISKGVKDNLKGQEQVLNESQKISETTSSGLFQQQSILDQVGDQLVLQGKPMRKLKHCKTSNP